MKDDCCEVRTAMVYAMTTFLGIPEITDEVERIEELITWTIMDMAYDGNAMVRKELLCYVSKYVSRYENKFVVAAFEHLKEDKEILQFPPKEDGSEAKLGLHYARPAHRNPDGTISEAVFGVSQNSVYAYVWKQLVILCGDPHPEVQKSATIVTDYVHRQLLESGLATKAQALMDDIFRLSARANAATKLQSAEPRPSTPQQMSNTTPPSSAQPGLLKRTASYLFAPIFTANSSNESATVEIARNPSKASLSNRHSLPSRGRVPSEWNAPPEQNDVSMTPGSYHAAKEPMSGGFKPRDMKSKPSIPIHSDFLEWSIEYFREPQMRSSESEEPGSTEYNEKLWRRNRNETILRETQPQKDLAGSAPWSTSAGVFNNGSQPSKITMHQFEDHLAVSDDRDTVCVWDWKKKIRLARFSNGNPEGSKISDLKFINEDDQALLMTGSSDGVLRLYRKYNSDEKIELASSWRALTHMVPSNVNSGMVFDWQQVTGKVLVAGDVKVIRVWSAGKEVCEVDINARSGSCITSLTSDQMTGNIFVAGFGDGAIRVFDTRMNQGAMVKKWKDPTDQDWVRSVHMQRGGQRELLSASRNGKVKLWDIRMDKPLKVIRATKDVLRTASTHEHLPVFAV